MRFAVHHRVTKPDEFWRALDALKENHTSRPQIHQILRNESGDRAVTLWDGETSEEVLGCVESSLGPFSESELQIDRAARRMGADK